MVKSPNPKRKEKFFIRTRNIKLNIFLNEDEKQMLINKCKQAKLSQSDFFRMLIQYYTKDKMLDKNKIVNSLNNISDNLTKLYNQFNRLYEYDNAIFLNTQISNIQKVINEIQN
jgi:NAD+--asparagine ADP-ribosyltransferase